MLPSIILKFVGSVLLLKRIDNESVRRRSNDLLELVPQLVGKCNWISTAVRCAVQGCRKKMWTGVFPSVTNFFFLKSQIEGSADLVELVKPVLLLVSNHLMHCRHRRGGVRIFLTDMLRGAHYCNTSLLDLTVPIGCETLV